MNTTPLKTFIIYARDDKHHKDQLIRHLRPLVKNSYLDIWHDGNIWAGEDWEKQIKTNLKDSQLVLVLVSVNSLNSDFIESEELATAVERLQQGNTRIVPIIVAPCAWQYHHLFSSLQGLPANMRPVSDWSNQDGAWAYVVESLAKMAEEVREAEKKEWERLQRQQEAEKWSRERREKEKQEQKRREAEGIEKEQGEKEDEEKQKNELDKKREKYAAALAEAWRSAKFENTKKAYLQFAKMYPLHPLAQEAKLKAGQFSLNSIFFFKTYTLISLGALLILTLVVVLGIKNLSVKTISEPEMVFVAGGTFQMGSNEGLDDEKPIHAVTLQDFYIGKYEITQKQWRDIMGSDPPELEFKGCGQCPVESVSWEDVQEFLQKLNTKFPERNYRLPSEAEWEYAARGGQQSKGYKYAGGNNLYEVGWYWQNSGDNKLEGEWKYDRIKNNNGRTHLIAEKKPNELGLYDMSGNVWEWCADVWHDNYIGAPTDGSAWVQKGNESRHIIRGGSWNYGDGCRSANRGSFDTTIRHYNSGFRLARHP